MARTKVKTRTLRFYEVVNLRKPVGATAGDKVTRKELMPAKPWDAKAEFKRLEGLATQKGEGEPEDGTAIRTYGGSTLIGEVHAADGPDSVDLLALSKVTPSGDLDIRKVTTGVGDMIEMSDDQGVALESHVAMLPNNVVAIIGNGVGSPSREDVERYLANKLGLRSIKLVALQPVGRRAEIRDASTEILKVQARLDTGDTTLKSKGTATSVGPRDLLRTMSRLGAEVIGPHATLDVTISMGPSATGPERSRMKDLADDMLSEADAERLKIHYKTAKEAKRQAVNMLEDVLAQSVDVVVTDRASTKDEKDRPQRPKGSVSFVPEQTAGVIRKAYDDNSQLIAKSAKSNAEAEPFTRSSWVATHVAQPATIVPQGDETSDDEDRVD